MGKGEGEAGRPGDSVRGSPVGPHIPHLRQVLLSSSLTHRGHNADLGEPPQTWKRAPVSSTAALARHKLTDGSSGRSINRTGASSQGRCRRPPEQRRCSSPRRCGPHPALRAPGRVQVPSSGFSPSPAGRSRLPRLLASEASGCWEGPVGSSCWPQCVPSVPREGYVSACTQGLPGGGGRGAEPAVAADWNPQDTLKGPCSTLALEQPISGGPLRPQPFRKPPPKAHPGQAALTSLRQMHPRLLADPVWLRQGEPRQLQPQVVGVFREGQPHGAACTCSESSASRRVAPLPPRPSSLFLVACTCRQADPRPREAPTFFC